MFGQIFSIGATLFSQYAQLWAGLSSVLFVAFIFIRSHISIPGPKLAAALSVFLVAAAVFTRRWRNYTTNTVTHLQ